MVGSFCSSGINKAKTNFYWLRI
uniref:Uncharacterized protein n=1 Tax=Rhizophora mucronata TaxID=61149 RepID=A0A2P2NIQ2_RHIMU